MTQQDIEKLRHWSTEHGAYQLRALNSDLAYGPSRWPRPAPPSPGPRPTEALLLEFVVYHLWLPEQRDIDPHRAVCQPLTSKTRATSGSLDRWVRHGAPAACQFVDTGEMARLLPFGAEGRDTPRCPGDAVTKETLPGVS